MSLHYGISSRFCFDGGTVERRSLQQFRKTCEKGLTELDAFLFQICHHIKNCTVHIYNKDRYTHICTYATHIFIYNYEYAS